MNKMQQLNELRKLRSQAKEMQKELEKITETVEEDNIKVKVRGDQKIEYIEIDGEERKDIADAINKAMKNVQKEAAKKMMQEGGGLSGLLGGLK
ncbi:MAG: hypothetical protein UV56_C0009G0004 [Candidatus Woesebacteria bacterium GW2011_GWC1_43_10b]|uniref:Nucleoid-associated protein n=1 Tax=Candidatus Woesebacteria bacterium GW2011_GWC1_43_10b TaxID=1618585 RepID=A0A0G1C531_9BACT|nr:MAG: hypothetical protein UV56_C0009G0004 [Candidatus Woesebacteria bacterium GW2011_GWC1_43_10b]